MPDLARKALPPGLLSSPRRVQGKLLKKQVPPRWLSYSHSQPSTDMKGGGCWQCSPCQAETQLPQLPQSSSHQAPIPSPAPSGQKGASQRVCSRQDWEKHLMCVGKERYFDQTSLNTYSVREHRGQVSPQPRLGYREHCSIFSLVVH